MAARNLLNPISDQLCYILELLLSSGNMSGINISFLEMREEELTWGSIVAVRTKNHVW